MYVCVKSLLLPLPRETHASAYEPALLPSLSGAMDCSMVILYLTADSTYE